MATPQVVQASPMSATPATAGSPAALALAPQATSRIAPGLPVVTVIPAKAAQWAGAPVPKAIAKTAPVKMAAPQVPAPAAGAASSEKLAAAAPESHREIPGHRLKLAREVVAKLLPPGQYRTMMTAVLAETTAGLVKQMKGPALAQSLAAIGMVDGANLKQEDIDKAVAILDPTYDERIALSTQAVNDGVQEVVARMEPQMREALAASYSHNFDDLQLADILRFFDTPTGSAYASRVMLMTTDPAVKNLGSQIMPSVMRAMPAIMDRAQAATAVLPQPRDPGQLSESERKKVANLLRMDIARR